MLSFDIETTGLNPTDRITAACAYDPVEKIQATFIFPTGGDPEEFMQLLDNAQTLCAFNGARFDIPFIQRAWGVPEDRVARWILKLVDVYDMCYLVFKKGFSLNRLLTLNQIPVKTGDGKEAIELALQNKWQELGDYCMQDTIKTHTVTSLPVIKLPLTHCQSEVQLNSLLFQVV